VNKVSARELFVLIAVGAVGLGWWLDRSHLAHEDARHKEVLMKMRRLGLDVGSVVNMPELSAELNAEYEAEHLRRTSTKAGNSRRFILRRRL
jgi:hypothetical protein